MGNSLRCCLACVLPCGALDLIRVVHLDGTVEEFTRPVTAGEILKANPSHVLSKPSSHGVVHRILILSPDSELKRGGFYFLIPTPSLPPVKKNSCDRHRKCRSKNSHSGDRDRTDTDGYATKVVMENKPPRRHRHRRIRPSGVWQPNLESISEN